MSKPHNKQNHPASPGQIKTMFVTESQPIALVVSEGLKRRQAEEMRFKDVADAFKLARRNRWNFVYSPGIDLRS